MKAKDRLDRKASRGEGSSGIASLAAAGPKAHGAQFDVEGEGVGGDRRELPRAGDDRGARHLRRYDYLLEKKEAFEKLSNAVESIVGPTSKDKVGTHAERLVQPEGAVLLR